MIEPNEGQIPSAPARVAANATQWGKPGQVVPLSVDESGALRISGSISATVSGADGALLDGTNPAIKATVLDYTNSNPLAVRLTDLNGDIISTVPVAGSLTVTPGTDSTRVHVATGLPLPSGASTAALQTQPGVDIGDVTVNNAGGGAAVNIQDGGNSITVDGSLNITPSTDSTRVHVATGLPLPSGASTAALQTQPGVDIGDVTINNAAGAAAVNIQDGGNSITVDGSLSVTPSTDSTRVHAATGWPLPSGAATSALQTQPGVDIGDVTVNNGAGASAVNIQDGGNSITVDGSLSVTPSTDSTRVHAANGWPLPSGAATETTLSTLNGKITACDTGAVTIAGLPNEGQQTMANSISVAIASNQGALPITDNGGSITVDGDLTLGNDDPIRVYAANGWPLPSGAATAALQLPDSHNVTVDNASGAAAVNIQDGGNSITVDVGNEVTIITDDSIRVHAATGWPLPSGAATEATLSTLNGKITACDTGAVTIAALPNEGQQAMASSISVAIASNQSAIPITDNNGSITVDGDLTLANDDPIRVYAANGWPLPSGASTSALQTQPGVDIGDVTINNASGAAAVNIQDGGNSITVDGTVAVTPPTHSTRVHAATGWPLPSGAATEATLATLDGKITACDTGNVTIATLPNEGQQTMANSISVAVASNQSSIPINDAGGSITVDGSLSVVPSDHPTRVYAASGWPLPSGASQSVLEDSAHVSGDAGVLGLTVRNDSNSVLTSQDLDYSATTSDSRGNLRINMVSGTLTSALPAGTNVLGHVILDTGSTTAVTQATGTNLHMVVDSGIITTVSAVTAISNALPAGTNAIGKLAANSGVDIGDVDITSIAAGDNNIGNVDIASSVLPTGASTLAEQQSQTTHLATIAGDTTSIQTAVELIDNTVAVLGTATYTEASTSGLIIGAVRRDADTTLVGTTNEVGPLQMNDVGQLKVEVFSGATLPVSLTSTTVTGTVAVTQSGAWDEVGIHDSGNSITVDGTVTVTGVATEVTLASLLTSSQLLDDSIVVLGTDVYTEAASKGQVIGAVRRDADTTLVGTTNEFGPLQMDALGRLKVEAFSGEALPVTLTSTTVTGTVAVTQSGTWDEVGINDSGNSITVDGTVTVTGVATEVTLASLLTSSQLIDDTVYTDDTSTHATGTSKGVGIMAAATPTDTAIAANDIGMVAMTVDRKLHVAVMDALPAGTAAIGKLAANTGVDIGDVDITSIAAGDNNIGNVDIVSGTITTVSTVTAVTTLTNGGIAHDAADSGNPHKVGFKAYSPDGTTPGTAVAELDRSDAKCDLDGRLYTNTIHPRNWSFHSDGSAALTDASVAADPGDGFQLVVTSIIFSTGAATACNIFFEEGASKVLGPWYLEAVAGRGVVWQGIKPITSSTALTVTTSAAIAQSLDVCGFIQAV